MAESTVVRTKRDIVLALTDGTYTYTVAYEPGDLQLDFPIESVNLFLDRGAIGTTPSIRLGDDQPITGGFSAYERQVWSSAEATLLDLCVRPTGSFVRTSWTSTMGSSSDVFTVTATVVVDGASFGEVDRTLTLTYCVLRGGRSDGDPNMVNVTLTSYQTRYTIS